MLTILLGTDWKTNRAHILNRIAADVKAQLPGRILMVPELISHDTERRLAFAAGDTASRFAEVLPFSRLVRRVSEEYGIGAGECLDNGGRLVAMAAAIRQISSKLKSYAGVLSRPEFLTGLLDAMDEFKRCCINPVDLRKAAGKTEGLFAQKLEELALILEAYDAVTAQGKRDPRDQMSWLLSQMEATDFASNHVFYIDGFPDLTRQHMAILEHLILESKDVTVSLICDVPGSKAFAFEKAGKTAAQLLHFARNNGIKTSVKTLMPEPSPLQELCLRLYQGKTSIIDGLDAKLSLFRADSLYDECSCAAERILSLVRGGCRFRDIGVICSDMGAYEDALRLIFSRSRIPFYRSGKDDVLQKSVVSSLLSAMNAALNGFEQTDVVKYLKSVLSPLDTEQCDLVENYSILWGIRNTGWTKPWEKHPDGLSGNWDSASTERLGQLEAARKLLIDPLVSLRDGFQKATNLSGQVQALCVFFDQIRLAPKMEQMAAQMDASGDNRSAQILNQLWDILLTALEQLNDMLGSTVWEQESFTRLFTLLLSQYDVGTIPTVLDSVMVGPVSAMRCHEVKHLLVLGAKEGSLPGYSGVAGVLTDLEREQLRALDVPLSGGGMEGIQSEFAELYGVFNCASESITVTCGPEQPSFLYSRLAAMAGREQTYVPNNGLLTTDPTDAAALLVAAGDASAADALNITSQYQQISHKTAYTIGNIDRENVAGIYGKKLNLSASQVDKQADCRLSYFLRYGLRAQELKEATVDPAEFGTYFHAVLEQTARRVMELGGFHKVSLEETVELAMTYSAEYISNRFAALDSARVSYLFERNVQELKCLIRELWMELSVSEFAPDQFEVGFGEGLEMPAVQIFDGMMDAQLRGFVDRVDKWSDGTNNYFRVVDYKSGKKSFDYCDVFNGMGLQMLLYMFALEQGGEAVLGQHPIPAGVQYFSARFPYLPKGGLIPAEEVEQARGNELKRKGLVLADENVLAAMEPEGAPKRLSVSYNKNGDLTGDIANSNQFAMLRKFVFKTLKRLVNEIASGNVSPNPYTRGDSHNACRFCPYGAVCHKSTVAGRRNYMAMKPQKFWEEVEKEVHPHG